jgi:hypothetical protein
MLCDHSRCSMDATVLVEFGGRRPSRRYCTRHYNHLAEKDCLDLTLVEDQRP